MGIFNSKKNVDFKSDMKSSHIPVDLPYQMGRKICYGCQDLEDSLFVINTEWWDMFDFKDDFGEQEIKKLCPEVCCNINKKNPNDDSSYYSGFSLIICLIRDELRCYIWDYEGDRTDSFIDRMMYHMHLQLSDIDTENLYRSINEDLFVLAKVEDSSFFDLLHDIVPFDLSEDGIVERDNEIIEKIRRLARNIIEFYDKENS